MKYDFSNLNNQHLDAIEGAMVVPPMTTSSNTPMTVVTQLLTIGLLKLHSRAVVRQSDIVFKMVTSFQISPEVYEAYGAWLQNEAGASVCDNP